MNNAEVLQEQMNILTSLKILLKKERMSSDTATEEEFRLMNAAFDYIDGQIPHALSPKERDSLTKNYLDVLCDRALTAEQMTDISTAHVGKYIVHRMAKDPDFMNGLLAELDTGGKAYQCFARSNNFFNAKHLDMVNLCKFASEGFNNDLISENQYADTMTKILQLSKKVLHKSDDTVQRKGCEDIMSEICRNVYRSGIKLSSYPELNKAYIGLEEECINHYCKTLKSIRGDIELSQQNVKTNDEGR